MQKIMEESAAAAAAAFVPAGKLPLANNRRKRHDIDVYAFMENFRSSKDTIRRLRVRAFLASLEPLCIPLPSLDLLACSQAAKNKYPQLLTVEAYLDWMGALPSAAFLQVMAELDTLMATRKPLTQACAVIIDACIQRYLYETHDTDCTFTKCPEIRLHSIPPLMVDLIPRLHRVMGMSLATHKNASTHISSISNKDAVIRIIIKCFPMRSAQRKLFSVIGKLNRKQPAILEHLRGFLACMLLGHNGVQSPEEMPRLMSRIGIIKLLGLHHTDQEMSAASATAQRNKKLGNGLFEQLLESCGKCIVFATREAMVRQIDLCPAIRRRMHQYVDYKRFRSNVRECTETVRRIFRAELMDPRGWLRFVPRPGGLALTQEKRRQIQRREQHRSPFHVLFDWTCQPLLASLDIYIEMFHDAILKAGRPGTLFSFLTRLHRAIGEVPPNVNLTGLARRTDINRRSLESRKLQKMKNELKQKREEEEETEDEAKRGQENETKQQLQTEPVADLAQFCVGTGVTAEHCHVLERLLSQCDPQTMSSDDMLTTVIPLLPQFVVAHPGTTWRVSMEGARALLELRNQWYTYHSTKKSQLEAVADLAVRFPYTYAAMQTIADLWSRQSLVQYRKLDFTTLHYQIQALVERYQCSVDQLPMLASHLWLCSVCLTIYSPLRDAGHCGSKPSFGLHGAVIDHETGQPWCYWSKEIMHTACQHQPLTALKALGREFFVARKRLKMCPQYACGHMTVYDPRTCHPAINERGFACPSCTIKILTAQVRQLRDTHPLGPGRIFECAVCYKNTGASVNTFIYGDNLMLCSNHHSPALAEYVREFLESRDVDWLTADITDAHVTKLSREAVMRYRQLLTEKKKQHSNARNRALLKRVKQQQSSKRPRR